MVAGVTVVFVLAYLVPLARDFFALEVQSIPALLYAVAVGLAGALGVELWYRIARSRGLVSDRE